MLTHGSRVLILSSAMCAAVCLCACGSDNKEISFKSGGMTHTFAEGKGSVPGNFPLPIYPNATATGSVSAQNDKDQEDAKFLMLTASDGYLQIGKYYQDQLKALGWKIDNVQNLPNLINIAASKSGLEASVMIASDPGKKTSISLAVSKSDAQPDKDAGSKNDAYSPDKITPPTD